MGGGGGAAAAAAALLLYSVWPDGSEAAGAGAGARPPAGAAAGLGPSLRGAGRPALPFALESLPPGV